MASGFPHKTMPGIHVPVILTITLSNGQKLEAPTELWVSAILASVPQELQSKIIETITQMLGSQGVIQIASNVQLPKPPPNGGVLGGGG